MSKKEIFDISERISKIINQNFSENSDDFFIKTSTGYYAGYGANINDIKIIKRASKNINIKASGGIKSFSDAISMIELGVNRIGTSAHFIFIIKNKMDLKKLLLKAINTSIKGGQAILKIYETDFDVDYKQDNSP